MSSAMDFVALLTKPSYLATLGISVIILTLLVHLYSQAFSTDIGHISGIPEPSGAVPFYGHLKLLGDDHPSKFEEWSVQNGWPVIQAKFGTRRVLVLNSFQAAQDFIVRNATATIDRPLFWTFHNILSTTQGGTIGTSPWSDITKGRRTAVAAYMTRPAIQRSAQMIDIETGAIVQDLFRGSLDGEKDVSPEVYFKRMALNVTMEMCYGTRFDDVTDPLLLRILHIAETVSTFRSTNRNFQDYIPLLRYCLNSKRSNLAAHTRKERDDWLEQLFNAVRESVDSGTAKPCITESLLSEKEANTKLTLDDIKSINVSLVSGGYETVATTGLAGLGLLATAEGQSIQDKAYQDLMKHYGSVEEAWEKCVVEEKSEYIVALVREMLRYFAAIQFLPPRLTTKEFVWNGVKIPKGVTVIQNAQAINHSRETYGEDADKFRPERWIPSSDNTVPPVPAPYHYSFGGGSRACPAIAFSNRVLYTAFARLIVLFRVLPAQDGGHLLDTNYVGYNSDTTLQTCKVKPYTVRLAPRNGDKSEINRCFAHTAFP